MAAYISIDFSKLPAVSAQATALGRKMDATRDELIALQEQLQKTQNYLEKRYDTCWDRVVPIKRLRKQSEKMDDVVSVLSTADTLAKGVDNKLKAQARLLKLAVSAVGSFTVSAKTILARTLIGETDCGNDWADVGEDTKPNTAVNSGGYSSPLPGKTLKVNSPYYRNGSGAYHGGVDFAAAEGTTLAALQGGKVLFAGVEKLKNGSPAAGGNCILIKGTDGYYYYYAHLKTIGVKVGDTVSSGAIIGETGKSTGTIKNMKPHLHVNVAIPVGSDIEIPPGSGKNGTGAAEWFGNKQAVTIDPVKFLEEKGVL